MKTKTYISGKITARRKSDGSLVIIDGHLRWKAGVKTEIFTKETIEDLIQKGIIEIVE